MTNWRDIENRPFPYHFGDMMMLQPWTVPQGPVDPVNLFANTGAYTVGGVEVGRRRALRMTASAGSVSVSGQAATLALTEIAPQIGVNHIVSEIDVNDDMSETVLVGEPPPWGRRVFFLISYLALLGGSYSISGVTLDGNAATIHTQRYNTTSKRGVAIASIAFGGSDIDGAMVVTFSNQVQGWHISIVPTAFVKNSSPTDTDNWSSGSPIGGSLDVPDKGFVLAAFAGPNFPTALADVIEDNRFDIIDSGSARSVHALAQNLAADATYTVSATYSGSDAVMCALSWR